MAGLLISYLQSTQSKRFSYGSLDCAQWVSQYIKMVCGVDPGVELLSEYYDEASCAELIIKKGSLLRGTEIQFEKYPNLIIECDCCYVGYEVPVVGVVEYLGVQFLAIRVRNGWAMKKRDIGYHVVPFGNGKLQVIKSWRLECPPSSQP